MDPVPHTDGLFTFDLLLKRHTSWAQTRWGCREEFQIVRNKDWNQLFYPVESDNFLGFEVTHKVAGPDGDGTDLKWVITGALKEVYRIEFQRSVTDDDDTKSVRWYKVAG